MATMTKIEAFEAMLAHHAHLGAQVEGRVQALHGAVDVAFSSEGSGHELAVAGLVAFLGDEVLPHAAAEEQTVYAAAAGEDDLATTVEEMIGEHRRLVALVEELAAAETGFEAAGKGEEIAGLFRAHVTKENEILLPPLLADDACDLAGLLTQMHQLTEAPPEGRRPGDGTSGSDLEDTLVSLLLEATTELSRTGEADRACRSAAAAWRVLRAPRPDLAVRATATLHGLARMATAAPVTWRAADTAGSSAPDVALDVRSLAPAKRHETIFAAYEQLPVGAGFVLVNDHDPKPLRYQFEAEYAGEFTWDYLESGPRTWRVRIGRPPVEVLR